MTALERRRPVRIQRSRRKGYRMPTGTVSVARPSRLGNPFRVGSTIEVDGWGELPVDAELAVALFRAEWRCRLSVIEQAPELCDDWIDDLRRIRGADLACYCPTDQPCHADVLLELANDPETIRLLDTIGATEP